MEVIVLESKAYQNLIETLMERLDARFRPDSLMTMEQVMEYTGYGRKWLDGRKEMIGYIQDGKELRFRKSDLDAYLNKHFIRRK